MNTKHHMHYQLTIVGSTNGDSWSVAWSIHGAEPRWGRERLWMILRKFTSSCVMKWLELKLTATSVRHRVSEDVMLLTPDDRSAPSHQSARGSAWPQNEVHTLDNLHLTKVKAAPPSHTPPTPHTHTGGGSDWQGSALLTFFIVY